MTAYTTRPLTPIKDAALITKMWAAWFPTQQTSARMGQPVAYVARITAR